MEETPLLGGGLCPLEEAVLHLHQDALDPLQGWLSKLQHILWLTVSIVWSTNLYITSLGSHLEGCVEAQGDDVHLLLLLGAGSFL